MNFKEAAFSLIFFIAITIIFFYNIFLGLIPLPSDLIVGGYYPWLSYKWGYAAGVPVKNTKLSDAVSIFYPMKDLIAKSFKKGELPLWNPYMFGGYPLFASVSFGLLFPTMIFYLIFQTSVAWTLQTMSQPILASFFMYLLLRHLKLDKTSSVFGSIVFGFGGFIILWMQWNTQATTALFLPILILLLDKYILTKNPRWGVLLSIAFALQIFAGYLPILPFTIVALVGWYIFRAKEVFFKAREFYSASVKVIFFVILGILLSAVYLLPVAELIGISQRKVERLISAGPFTPPENFINLLAPDFFGNDATGNFWGRGDHMDATLYVGITTLILSLLSTVIFFKKTEAKFAICLFVVSVIFSISNPLSDLLYRLGIWGGPSITMNRVNFLMNFALSILGGYGISAIRKSNFSVSLKPVIPIAIIALGVTSGLLISKQILLKSLSSTTSYGEAINWLARIDISLRNMILPSLLIILIFLLIYLLKKYEPIRRISAHVLILILIFELFRFGLKFNTFSKPPFIYPQTPITEFLKNYPNDRFIAESDILPANMWVPFRISSIGGYETIYPLNIAKLLAAADSSDANATPMTKWAILQNFNSKILDETNTRFLLVLKRNKAGKPSSSGEINPRFNIPKYKKVFEDKEVAVLENNQVLPRVYLTKTVIKESDQQTLRLLLDQNFLIQSTSITDDFEFSNSEKTLNSDLEYKPITNSYVVIKANTNIDAYLVVLDSFYPGWKASIDGKESKIHRTNYNFRGIFLPKGNHIVEFVYRPETLKYGAIISAVALLIIILILTFPFFKKIYDSR